MAAIHLGVGQTGRWRSNAPARSLSSHYRDNVASYRHGFRQQSDASNVVDGMLGDVPGIMFFDHGDAGVVQARYEPDWYISQQHANDAGMSQRVHRHHVGIETDGGHDLVYLAMIILPRISIPRRAVALQQQRRVVDTPFRRCFEPGGKLRRDRHRNALDLLLVAISAP